LPKESDHGSSGNYGTLDLKASLEWIRDKASWTPIKADFPREESVPVSRCHHRHQGIRSEAGTGDAIAAQPWRPSA